MQFKGTKNYIATDDLSMAVNASVALERPLLIKGEPGTGKTLLAIEVADALGLELIEWHIKSTTKATQGLYEYDAVTRLRDSQLGDERVKDIANYIKKGKLGKLSLLINKSFFLLMKLIRLILSFQMIFSKRSIVWNSFVMRQEKQLQQSIGLLLS